jgi:uncharacterized protein YkwD
MHENSMFRALIGFTTPAALILLVLFISAIHAPAAAADRPLLADRGIAAQICWLINDERQARGLASLTEAAEVDGVAVARALDMASAGYLGHVSPSGTNAADLLHDGGVAAALVGENIGRSAGYTLGEAVRAVHAAWMASAGHRGNVLDPRFSRVGIAAVVIADVVYVVVLFAD